MKTSLDGVLLYEIQHSWLTCDKINSITKTKIDIFHTILLFIVEIISVIHHIEPASMRCLTAVIATAILASVSAECRT